MNKSIVFLCLFFISSILNILFAQNCVEDNLKTLGQISDVDAYLQKNKRRTSIIKDYALNKSDSLIKVIEDFHKNLDACNRELNGLENFTKFSKIQSSITLLKVLEMSGKIEHFQDLMTELDSIYPNLESLPIDFSYPNGAEEGKIKITNENAESSWLAYAFYRASFEVRRGNWASVDRYLQYGAKLDKFKSDLTFLSMYFKTKEMLNAKRDSYFDLLPTYTKYLIVKVEDVLPGSSSSSFRNPEFIDSILTYEVSSTVAVAENNLIDKNGFIRHKIADNLFSAGKYELAYLYAIQASEVSNDKELAYFISDYLGNKFPERSEEFNAAANNVFKNYINASSNVPDLIRLKDYAIKKENKEIEELAIARLKELNKNYKTVETRMKDSRRTVGAELRAETSGLFLGHIPIYLRVRIRNFINDFMFDYINYEKSRYRYGGFREKPLPQVSAPFRVNGGYSLGYSLKYIVLRDFIQKDRRIRYSGLAIGPEFRYSRWNMSQRKVDIYMDRTMNNFLGSYYVSPRQVRYEGTILLDLQFAWKFFSLGLQAGAGIGHRNLKEPGFTTEYWRDSQYTQARFNKFYVPVRFGIFLGFGYTSGE